jgi:hypothetical protein
VADKQFPGKCPEITRHPHRMGRWIFGENAAGGATEMAADGSLKHGGIAEEKSPVTRRT